MGRLLFLIFVVVPAVELILLIEIGQRVGTINTLALIVVTGVVGASLARQQGVSTFARLRRDLGEGRSPAVPIIDGVLILVAAAFLVTPGVLTGPGGLSAARPDGTASGTAIREAAFRARGPDWRCRCDRGVTCDP